MKKRISVEVIVLVLSWIRFELKRLSPASPKSVELAYGLKTTKDGRFEAISGGCFIAGTRPIDHGAVEEVGHIIRVLPEEAQKVLILSLATNCRTRRDWEALAGELEWREGGKDLRKCCQALLLHVQSKAIEKGLI